MEEFFIVAVGRWLLMNISHAQNWDNHLQKVYSMVNSNVITLVEWVSRGEVARDLTHHEYQVLDGLILDFMDWWLVGHSCRHSFLLLWCFRNQRFLQLAQVVRAEHIQVAGNLTYISCENFLCNLSFRCLCLCHLDIIINNILTTLVKEGEVLLVFDSLYWFYYTQTLFDLLTYW